MFSATDMSALGEGMDSLVNTVSSASVLGSTILSPYITSFFESVVLLVLCAIFRVKSKFTQYYSMYLHIAIVSLLLGLVSTYFMTVTQSMVDVLSLGGLIMPHGSTFDPLYMGLTAISAASIWQAVLVALGLKTFTGCSSTKAYAISGISLLLMAGVSAGTAVANVMVYDVLYRTLEAAGGL
jgi:hypothetical protein